MPMNASRSEMMRATQTGSGITGSQSQKYPQLNIGIIIIIIIIIPVVNVYFLYWT